MAYKQSKGFSTVACSGQDNLVADEHKDTLTFIEGTGVVITTNASTDALTITSATELSQDTTPQLAGSLDVNGQTITSASNGHVVITPNGSGNVGIGTASPGKTLEIKAGGSGDGLNLISHGNAVAVVQLESGSAGGYVQIHNSSGDQKVRLDSTGSSFFSGGSLGIGTDSPAKTLDVSGDLKVSGTTTLNSVEYTWPSSDGSSSQHLTTNASGALSWASAGSSTLSGLTDTDISSAAVGHILVRDASNDSFNNVAVSGDATLAAGGALTLATVAIAKGGTGATTVAAARTALSVDVAGTDNSTAVTLATVSDNYLSLSGQAITAGTIPLTLGGTGATSAGAARTTLGVDAAGTDNSTNVTLVTVSDNYLSLSGQAVTAGTVPLTLGGTGATSAGAARTALGVDAAGADNSTNVTLANTNYLSINGQAITGGTVPVGSGGTGLTSVTSGHVLYASGTNTIAGAAPGGTSGVQAYHSHLDKISSAGNGSDGQVLTSDGAGEIAWETVSGGGGGGSIDLLGSSTSAITAGDTSAITAAKTSAYTVSTSNVIVPVNSSSAAVTVTLYAASGNAGRIACIKDVGGAAYTNNITIDANSSETIDGAATQTIASNYGSVSMFCDGSAWFII